MKIRIGILALGVVMSAPAAAMRYRPMPAPVSYKTPALIGGALLAAYGVASLYDWLATGGDIWPIQADIRDSSKIYNWRLAKYDYTRPVEQTRNSATYTNHGSWNQDKFDYFSFSDAIYEDLKTDYNAGTFNKVRKEAEDKERKAQVAQEPVQLTHQRYTDEQIQEFLFKRIQEEKIELEEYLDTIVEASRYTGGWHNIRKAYKQICKQQKAHYGQERDWSHATYEAVDARMQSIARTGLVCLLFCKPMYGSAARLYWDVLKRYARLEKIEHCLMKALKREVIVSSQEQTRRDDRKKKHKEQDQTLSNWLWYKTIDPIHTRFFAS